MVQNQKPIKSLPKPRIGIVVNIPIDFWLEYLELHGLEVTGSRNGIVICRLVATETKPGVKLD
jgi:hypothetical protein